MSDSRHVKWKIHISFPKRHKNDNDNVDNFFQLIQYLSYVRSLHANAVYGIHMVEIAEIICGCLHPPCSAICQTWHPLDHPQACYMPRTSCLCTKASYSRMSTKAAGAERVHSVQMCHLSLLLVRAQCVHETVSGDDPEGVTFGMWHCKVGGDAHR